MLSRNELKTISDLMTTLNYYQILKVSPLATDEEIQDAFHKEALIFHPDQYFSSDDKELLGMAKSVYAKVVESYRILSDRQKRISYDNKLKGIDRIDEDENADDEDAITSVKRKPDWAASGPGEKFYKLAETALQSGDVNSANMNIQIAIGTEPSNPKFMKLKDKVAVEVEKRKAKKKKS